MRSVICTLLFLSLFGFGSTASASGGAPDSAVCLVVQGSFENAFYKDKSPCMVEVLRNGQVQDTLRLTRFRRKFWYAFERDCCYTLRVTKRGFAPMLIAVDTRMSVPGTDILCRFDFDAHLITEKRASTFDAEMLQVPYAQITYSETHKGFMIDEAYTEKIKAGMVLRGRPAARF